MAHSLREIKQQTQIILKSLAWETTLIPANPNLSQLTNAYRIKEAIEEIESLGFLRCDLNSNI
jgi:hypothetical protein